MTNQRITNQELYKKRADLYLIQTKLASANEDQRKELIAEKSRLETELKSMLEKFASGRQYCNDNKCSDMKQLTTRIKHLPDNQVL